jgi:hypothetical protein
MNIGFDLDNIFINTPPLIPQSIIERLYRKKTNGELQYRIPSRKEQILRQFSHTPLFRQPIKKNLKILKNITKDSHGLYLISSRFGFLKNHTEKLVKKHKLGDIFHTLYFNFDNRQPHIFKSDIINKLKLDKYVDDDLHLIKYIASKNNHIKLYWLNKKVNKQISKNIKAVTDLADILSE